MNGFNMSALRGNLQNGISNVMGTMKQMGEMANKFEQIQKIVRLVQNGGNPMELLSSFAQKNPQAEQMMNNLNGKSPDELRSYAENMAKSYGTSLEEVAKKIGISLPNQ